MIAAVCCFLLKSPGFWRDSFSLCASKGKNKHIKFAGTGTTDCLEARNCNFYCSLCGLPAFKIRIGLARSYNKREINVLYGYFGTIRVGKKQYLFKQFGRDPLEIFSSSVAQLRLTTDRILGRDCSKTEKAGEEEEEEEVVAPWLVGGLAGGRAFL